MDRPLEFIDAWTKAQKEFMENWLKSQTEFMENWLAAVNKIQESFLAAGAREGMAKETFDAYQTWLAAMVKSSKLMTDEAARTQETWKKAVEKQMDLNRELVRSFSGLFSRADDRK